MSRFRKLTHVVWHCQYHIVWVPKYRYRILKDRVGFELSKMIRVFSERLGCEVFELNVQEDHVHLLVMVPPRCHQQCKTNGMVRPTFQTASIGPRW